MNLKALNDCCHSSSLSQDPQSVPGVGVARQEKNYKTHWRI